MDKNLQWRLSILQFLQYFVWGSWFVTAGSYLLHTLEFTGREVGFVYATTAISASVSPLILGIVADRYFSIERILCVLHIIGAGLLVYLSYQSSFVIFYTVIMIYMLCYLPTFSLTNSLCFHHIPNPNKDFPKVRVWGTIAWIVAGGTVSYLNIELTQQPFLISAGCSILLAIYALTLPKTPPLQDKTSNFLDIFHQEELKALFSEKSLLILIVSVAMICIPSAYYYSFTNAFLNEIKIPYPAAKMSIGQMTEIVAMLLLPYLFVKWKMKTIIWIGLFAWGIRYGLFIIGNQHDIFWLIYLALGCHGVAYIFSMLSAQIYLDSRVPKNLRATMQGFFSFLTLGLFALIGTLIAGETVSYYSLGEGMHDWDKIWMIPFAVGCLVTVFFIVFFNPKINKRFIQ